GLLVARHRPERRLKSRPATLFCSRWKAMTKSRILRGTMWAISTSRLKKHREQAGLRRLLGVVEDDGQTIADAGRDGAHTMAQAGPVIAPRPRERPVMRGEDEGLSLVQSNHIAA